MTGCTPHEKHAANLHQKIIFTLILRSEFISITFVLSKVRPEIYMSRDNTRRNIIKMKSK